MRLEKEQGAGMRIAVAGFVLSWALTSIATAAPGRVGNKVDDFELRDYRGKTWRLSDFKDRVVVVAFLGTECPLVKLYGSRLAEIEREYRKRSVAFIGINSNVQDSITEIAAYARRYKIEFPILKDVGNRVAKAFGAARTPEIFVLDENRVVRYHGRIDDQYGVGYVRDEAKKHFLRDAIDALLDGKQVAIAHTEPVGCIIGRVHQAKKDSRVTYCNQIARILQNRCVECHRQGEIAPFALTSYDEVAGWAEMIAEVVEQGRMPPWHASPKYGHFANDRRLTQKEKDLIYEWVRNGAPRGNPADLPKPKQYVTGWQLPRKPDLVLNLREKPFRVPATGAVRYQYFIVDPGFKEDKWVTGAQLLPGNRAVVHHILAFAIGPDARQSLREVQGGAGGFLFGYVPGQRSYTFPPGMAKKIPAGSKLVFQVHYTPVGTVQYDQSKLGLLFAEPNEVQYEIHTRSAFNRFLLIRPNASKQRFEATSRPLPEGALLLGFSPHMHLRGQAFRYEAVLPDGKRQILLDVPQYDFNWQTNYLLARPMALPAGTRIHCIAWYDNSEDNLNNPDPSKWVRWGDQTWDEMMIGYYHYALPVKRSARKTPPQDTPARPRFNREQLQKFFRTLDKNGDGKISRQETPALLRRRFDRADGNGDGYVTLPELIEALTPRNRE